MFSKQRSIQIQAPPEAVFGYVSDLKRHPEWAAQRMEMEVHDQPVRAGTTFDAVTYYMGKETAKGKVVEVTQPSRFAFETDTSSSGRYLWSFEASAAAGGTRLVQQFERLEAPAWFKVMQPLLWPLVGRKMLDNGLKNIKARVESGAAG